MKHLKILIVGLITALSFSVGIAAPPIIKTATNDVQKIYLSQIGVREATGHNDGKVVEMYLHNAGVSKGNPWCAAFVKWCYDKGRVGNYMTAAAASAHNVKNLCYNKNKLIKEPKPGDAFTLYFLKLGRIGHTGFYNKRLNSTVYQSVEGNTNEAGSREGDGVYVKYRSFRGTYSISRWIPSLAINLPERVFLEPQRHEGTEWHKVAA